MEDLQPLANNMDEYLHVSIQPNGLFERKQLGQSIYLFLKHGTTALLGLHGN